MMWKIALVAAFIYAAFQVAKTERDLRACVVIAYEILETMEDLEKTVRLP